MAIALLLSAHLSALLLCVRACVYASLLDSGQGSAPACALNRFELVLNGLSNVLCLDCSSTPGLLPCARRLIGSPVHVTFEQTKDSELRSTILAVTVNRTRRIANISRFVIRLLALWMLVQY